MNTTNDSPRREVSKIIGLTGGIGSGKSSVAKILETKGYPVYYSDDRAKVIVNEDEVLKDQIKSLLGSEAYDQQGNYDRKFVSNLVFNNTELLEQLNRLIHPAVKLDFEKWWMAQTSEFSFKETALLFELELDKSCYKSLLVTADENLRIKRVMDRDGKTYREVERVVDQQMPEKIKIKKANYVIYNNSDFVALSQEVDQFISELN